MNNFFVLTIGFLLGQSMHIAISAYYFQLNKDIAYFDALKIYAKKETGSFVIAFLGLLTFLFTSSDFIDFSLKKADLKGLDSLTLGQKLVVYFRTVSFFIGAFIQHILLLAFKAGKKELDKIGNKIEGV